MVKRSTMTDAEYMQVCGEFVEMISRHPDFRTDKKLPDQILRDHFHELAQESDARAQDAEDAVRQKKDQATMTW